MRSLNIDPNAKNNDTLIDIENVDYTGPYNAELTGDTNDNVITSGSGDDILTGGIGNDTLMSGAGDDRVLAVKVMILLFKMDQECNIMTAVKV